MVDIRILGVHVNSNLVPFKNVNGFYSGISGYLGFRAAERSWDLRTGLLFPQFILHSMAL